MKKYLLLFVCGISTISFAGQDDVAESAAITRFKMSFDFLNHSDGEKKEGETVKLICDMASCSKGKNSNPVLSSISDSLEKLGENFYASSLEASRAHLSQMSEKERQSYLNNNPGYGLGFSSKKVKAIEEQIEEASGIFSVPKPQLPKAQATIQKKPPARFRSSVRSQVPNSFYQTPSQVVTATQVNILYNVTQQSVSSQVIPPYAAQQNVPKNTGQSPMHNLGHPQPGYRDGVYSSYYTNPGAGPRPAFYQVNGGKNTRQSSHLKPAYDSNKDFLYVNEEKIREMIKQQTGKVYGEESGPTLPTKQPVSFVFMKK